ncbi:MAG: hypothetical protein EBT79_14240 [Actinobacteria bacterium]|nr:hypothetical protein [Sphingomonadaceae bacterium]NBR68403.1 hypothetical protein [Actinomycetota bacterium]
MVLTVLLELHQLLLQLWLVLVKEVKDRQLMQDHVVLQEVAARAQDGQIHCTWVAQGILQTIMKKVVVEVVLVVLVKIMVCLIQIMPAMVV